MVQEVLNINSSLIISTGIQNNYSFTGIFTSGSNVITDVSPSQVNKLFYGMQIVASSVANNFSYTGLVQNITDTTITTDTVFDLIVNSIGLTGNYTAALPHDNVISVSSGFKTIFNNNNRDIDFQVKSKGSGSLYYDASTGRLGIGTGVPDAMLHVVSPCAKDGLILESTTNCTTGVSLLLLHNPGTTPQTGSTPSTINLAGRDTSYSVINYGQIKSRIISAEALKTSGEIVFAVDNTGIAKEIFVANLLNLVLGGNNTVSGSQYNLIGKTNYASGNNYLVIGNNNSGNLLNNSLSVGSNNTITGPNVLNIGSDSYISGTNIFFIGNNNDIVGNSGIVFGIDSNVTGSSNLLIVNNSNLNSESLLGLLKDSTISGTTGILLGQNINTTGNRLIGIGFNNSISGNNSDVIGSDSYVLGNSNIVFGNAVYLSGNRIVSIGTNQNISSITNGILIGNNIDFDSTSNIVYLGFNNTTDTGLESSVVVGGNNDLDNGVLSHIILLGQNNTTQDMHNSILIGNSNNLSGNIVNNLIFGSGNATVADGYNSIILGILNNQTGVRINSQGQIIGNASPIVVDNINSINIGIHNKTFLNNSNINVGNKNIISGLNINSIGSFNDLRNCNSSYIVGNSNYVEGNNTTIIGRQVFSLSDDSIIINNQSNEMSTYGSGIISIGNNYNVSSGNIIVGYDNQPGISGLIYGKDNIVGLSTNFFIYNTGSQQDNIIIINRTNPPFQAGDLLLLNIKNPVLKNSMKICEIDTISSNEQIGTTNILLKQYISESLTYDNKYFEINYNFDDNNIFVPNGSGNGILMLLTDNNDPRTYYGSNNIIFGDKNNVIYSNSIVLGNNNTTSGNNSIIIGNGIVNTGNNTVNIGSNNSNKIVIDNNRIVFNSGTVQQSIITKATDGSYAQFHNLLDKRLGINNSSPRSALDVSGTVTATSFRMGLSSNNGYVMSSDSEGNASWTLPVNLSGTNNSLLVKISDKVASGISDIQLFDGLDLDNNPTTYLKLFEDNIIFAKTGIEFNSQKGSQGVDAVSFTVWGEGAGAANALLQVDPSAGITRFTNISGISGLLPHLNTTSGVKLPLACSGTVLAMSGDRSLIARNIPAYGILFSSSNNAATGNNRFRWFNDNGSGILAIGGLNNIQTDSYSNNSYNIVLSSDPSVDTVFNNQNFNNNFSVRGSAGLTQGGEQVGFNIKSSNNAVGINTTMTALTTASSRVGADIKLFVGGTVAAKQFAIDAGTNAYPPTGYYLRVGVDGLVSAQPGSIEGSFTATYPLINFTNSLGAQSYKITTVEPNGTTNFDSFDGWGRTLVLGNGGEGWVVGSGLNIWQKFGSPSKAGMLVGYGGGLSGLGIEPIPSYHYVNTFAGGSFFPPGNSNYTKGTSQFSQFFLRTRTDNDGIKYMTMDWNTSNNSDTSAYNTMTIQNNIRAVWSFTAYVNVMWHLTGNSAVDKGAGAYIINGAVAQANNSASLIGVPQKIRFSSSSAIPHDVDIVINDDRRVDIRVSGANDYTMLWSSTINVNQTHWRETSLFSANS